MKSFNYVVQDKLGIHGRPAGMLVKEAKKYNSSIKIKKGEKEVNATQLMFLMGLAVKSGEEVTVTIDGEDEENAFRDMKAFFEENL